MTDPYLDPASGILRNTLGLKDQTRLENAEREITQFALTVLADNPIQGQYDLAHLQDFHRAIFKDIYPWAGEIRSVAISKGDMFCLPQHIASSAAEMFGTLAKDGFLRGLAREEFIRLLAHHLGEVNAIHPFREGNGRAQRAFFSQLAAEAGYALNWRLVDSQDNLAASIAIMRGNPEPMRRLLDKLVEPI